MAKGMGFSRESRKECGASLEFQMSTFVGLYFSNNCDPFLYHCGTCRGGRGLAVARARPLSRHPDTGELFTVRFLCKQVMHGSGLLVPQVALGRVPSHRGHRPPPAFAQHHVQSHHALCNPEEGPSPEHSGTLKPLGPLGSAFSDLGEDDGAGTHFALDEDGLRDGLRDDDGVPDGMDKEGAAAPLALAPPLHRLKAAQVPQAPQMRPVPREDNWPPLFLPCQTITYVPAAHPCSGRHDAAMGYGWAGGLGVVPPLPPRFETIRAVMDTWPGVLPIEALHEVVQVAGRVGKGKGGDTWLGVLVASTSAGAAALGAAGQPLPVVVKRPKALFPSGLRNAACPLEAGFTYLSPTPSITTAQYAAPPTGNLVRVNPTTNGYREAAMGRALTTVALAGATPHICTMYRALPTDIPYVLHTFMEPATVTLHAFLSQLRPPSTGAGGGGAAGRPLDLWLRVALLQTFQGMLAAHAALGVRHNDLHVENVLLAQGPPWALRPAGVVGGGPPNPAAPYFRYLLQDEGTAVQAVTVPTLGMCWKVIDFNWGSSPRMFAATPTTYGAGGGLTAAGIAGGGAPAGAGAGAGGGAGASPMGGVPGLGGGPPLSDHDVLLNMRQAAHARDHTNKRCACKSPNRPYKFSQASFDAELLINNAFLVTGTDTAALADLQKGLTTELQRVHKEAGVPPPSSGAGITPDADTNLARKIYRALILYLARPFQGLEAPVGTPVFNTCQQPPINLFHIGADRIVEAACRDNGDGAFQKALHKHRLTLRYGVPAGAPRITASPPIVVKTGGGPSRK